MSATSLGKIANGLQCVPEKRTTERIETTTVVQGMMVETWKYEDEDYVFECGPEVRC